MRWRDAGRDDVAEAIQPGHFGMDAFATTEEGACVHLGTDASPNACRIYEIRGTTCREFEKGSWQCLEYRVAFGVARRPSRPPSSPPVPESTDTPKSD